jgi:hypothetical protein
LARCPTAHTQDTTNLDQQEVIVGGATRGQDLGHNAETDAVAKLYFVRLPRPATDDTLLKKLQQDFQSHVAEIKGINTRLAAKRVSVVEFDECIKFMFSCSGLSPTNLQRLRPTQARSI